MVRRAYTAALLPLAVALLRGLPLAAADWRLCDGGVMTVTGGEVEPYPAHAGQEVTFRIHGTSDLNVSAGLLEVWVNYLGFHVYSRSGELCSALPCPLLPGPQTLEFKQELPRVAPPGAYLGVFQATAKGGPRLFCVAINFRISLTSGEAGVEPGPTSVAGEPPAAGTPAVAVLDSLAAATEAWRAASGGSKTGSAIQKKGPEGQAAPPQ